MNSLDTFILYLQNTMPSNLDEISKARYIYIKLGKIMSFDLEYAFGDSKKKNEIYNEIFYTEKNIISYFESKNIICKSLCYLYEYIVKKFDITISTIKDDYSLHTFNVILTNTGKKYFVDLQVDLENIQTHSKTMSFGINETGPYDEICEEDLVKMDIAIGYIFNESDYTDEYINMLKLKIYTDYISFEEQINYVLKSIPLFTNTYRISYFEYRNFNESTLKSLFNNRLFKRIHFCDCYYLENDLKKKFIYFISIKLPGSKNKIYYFSELNNEYVNVESEELKNMIKEGLVIRHGEISVSSKCINRENYKTIKI